MSVTVGYPDIPGLVKYLTMSDIPTCGNFSHGRYTRYVRTKRI
jgi:hypothetical protein